MRIQQLSKTRSQWEDISTKINDGEICFEKDTELSPMTYKMKIGDGNHKYAELPYFTATDSGGNDITTVISTWVNNNLDASEIALAEWDGVSKLSIYGISESNGIISKGDNHLDITVSSPLTISESNDTVTIGIQDATTSQKGAVTLTNTYDDTNETKATTGKAIKAAIETLDGNATTEDTTGSTAVIINSVSETDGVISSTKKTITEGNKIDISVPTSGNDAGKIIISHETQSQSSTTGSQLAFGGNVITDVSVDSCGHLTGKTISPLPNNPVSTTNAGKLMISGSSNTASESTYYIHAAVESSDSSNKVPTDAAVITYVGNQINSALATLTGALIYKGVVSDYAGLEDAMNATGAAAIAVGHTYIASDDFTHEAPASDTYLPYGTYEIGDAFIWNGSKWNAVSGENSIENKNATLNLKGESQTLATVDGTNITVTSPTLQINSPTASGNTTSFIDTLTVSNGQLSATKKTVPDASTSTKGIVKLESNIHSPQSDTCPTAIQTWTELNIRNTQFASGNHTNITNPSKGILQDPETVSPHRSDITAVQYLPITTKDAVVGLNYEIAPQEVNYIYRAIPESGDGVVNPKIAAIDTVKGNTLVWNQLVDANTTSVDTVSGHKYLTNISGVKSIITSNGAPLSVTGGTDCVHDLTKMFGSGYEPSSVAEFEARYPLNYYAYNAGTLINNSASGIKTVGFNQWDEQWELGRYSYENGEPVSANNRIRSKNYIPIIGGNTYYFRIGNPLLGAQFGNVCWYDGNKNFLSANSDFRNVTIDAPNNARYAQISITSEYGTTYNNDVCINLSWSGYRNGEYEPYEEHILYFNGVNGSLATIKGRKLNAQGEIDDPTVLSAPVFPDGMRSAGSVYDEIKGNVAIKRIIEIDLGNVDYVPISSPNGCYQITGITSVNVASAIFNIIGLGVSTTGILTAPDWSIETSNTGDIKLRHSAYTSWQTFKANMSGVKIYVVASTPETYLLDNPLPSLYGKNPTTEERLPADTISIVAAPIRYTARYDIAYVSLVTLNNLVDAINTIFSSYDGGSIHPVLRSETNDFDFITQLPLA